jgi:hypothetical protein
VPVPDDASGFELALGAALALALALATAEGAALALGVVGVASPDEAFVAADEEGLGEAVAEVSPEAFVAAGSPHAATVTDVARTAITRFTRPAPESTERASGWSVEQKGHASSVMRT